LKLFLRPKKRNEEEEEVEEFKSVKNEIEIEESYL
jgi:hypothetical protein